MKQAIGVKSATPSRPRRDELMLDRALKYARLHDGGNGMSIKDMEKKFNESDVTLYKLVRLGEAPKAVHTLIRKKEIPATIVSNAIKAPMKPREITAMVEAMVAERRDARKKLHEAGFQGGKSLTLRRALGLAIENIKKRHLVKGEGRKAIVRALNEIVNSGKPTVESIEGVILMN